jgi:protein-tyrosine phosphatase
MFKSVLVVCIGNVCRSPVGEALFKKYSDQYQLDLKVASAGVHALVGEHPQPYSQEVASEHGLNVSNYIAEQITHEMVCEYELILVLDSVVRGIFLQKYPFAVGKVSKFGRFENDRDIVDPYRKPKEAFSRMYDDIEQCTKSWLKAVWSKSVNDSD